MCETIQLDFANPEFYKNQKLKMSVYNISDIVMKYMSLKMYTDCPANKPTDELWEGVLS